MLWFYGTILADRNPYSPFLIVTKFKYASSTLTLPHMELSFLQKDFLTTKETPLFTRFPVVQKISDQRVASYVMSGEVGQHMNMMFFTEFVDY